MNHHQSPMMFDTADDFLDQILASVPASASSAFPWLDDEHDDQLLASKLRQHQISSGAAKALMLQQQLLLSRGPTGADAGLLPMPHADHNAVLDSASFKSANLANDESLKALFNGFNGSLGQTSNHPQPFHHPQPQNFSSAGASAAPAANQPVASGSSGGGAAGQPRPKVRARRGQATDPHSIAERLRRERIAERMKALQELVPNANKTDKASMLDEIIEYVKFLQLQVKVLSMSRLGGAAGVGPLVAADMSSAKGRNGNGGQTASKSNNDGGMTVTEHQVAKLMEEDMGSAMQYLQGKGLCLMPISLATAISTPSLSRKPAADGPTSPSMSVLTVQSGPNPGGEPTSVSKP